MTGTKLGNKNACDCANDGAYRQHDTTTTQYKIYSQDAAVLGSNKQVSKITAT
jgi:hypothetical protein